MRYPTCKIHKEKERLIGASLGKYTFRCESCFREAAMSKKVKKLAKKECLTLWGHLAKTGEACKDRAIEKLHSKGELSKRKYLYYCPFCEYLRDQYPDDEDDEGCGECIWPGAKKGKVIACTSAGSVYWGWADAESDNERKVAARAVYDLIQSIKI
jgi:hypothetical protein